MLYSKYFLFSSSSPAFSDQDSLQKNGKAFFFFQWPECLDTASVSAAVKDLHSQMLLLLALVTLLSSILLKYIPL